MMRYSLGAALALLAMASMVLQVAAALHPALGEKIEGEWSGLAAEGTLAALALLFYAPAATFAALAARAHGGRMASPASWIAAAGGIALCVLAVAAVGTLSPVVQTVLGGRWETSSETCELRGGKVRLVAAIANGRGEALAISRDSLLIELAPMLPGDRTMHEALERHTFRVLIDRVEGDILVVKPGETGTLRVEADLLRKELALIQDRRPDTACQLAANKLPSMLLITSGRRLDQPVEQETTAPEGAAQDELPAAGDAPPPVYHPGRATSASTH